jgi:hypothetical protein
MAGDWIKLHRKMLDSPIFRHDGLFRLWAYCLLAANWRPRKWLVPGTLREVAVGRGQFVTGRLSLHQTLYPRRDEEGELIEREWTPCPRTVWRWLEALRVMGCVNIETMSNRCSLVTVCNYSLYQEMPDGSCPADVPLMSRSCPADVPLMSTTEEGEEGKKSKTTSLTGGGVEPPPADSTPPSLEPAFLIFPCLPGKAKGPREWPLTRAKLAEYVECYPGVDVPAEARKALQWCRDNPAQLKTHEGVPSFLNRWFKKEQNASGRGNHKTNGQHSPDLFATTRSFLSRGDDDQA